MEPEERTVSWPVIGETPRSAIRESRKVLANDPLASART